MLSKSTGFPITLAFLAQHSDHMLVNCMELQYALTNILVARTTGKFPQNLVILAH